MNFICYIRNIQVRDAMFVCMRDRVNNSEFLSEHIGSRLEKFTVGFSIAIAFTMLCRPHVHDLSSMYVLICSIFTIYTAKQN